MTGFGGWILASRSSSAVSKDFATLLQIGTAVGRTDGSLLDLFRDGPSDKAEAAFAVLVERHGPMVLHVCRRILGDRHGAEDAAQATFLVLAQQAGSIRRLDSVASWLYGVAARVASRARRDTARRRARESRGAEVAQAIRRVDDNNPDAPEIAHVIHEELGRLPERFRLPIVLCHLEGLTYEQAANQIGCPVRTVQSRLTRARERLRNRLTRRGLGASVTPVAALLKPDVASAFVAGSWKHATARAAVHHAASGTAASLTSATVAALAEGASKAMMVHRLMNWAACLILIGVVAGGTSLAMRDGPEPARDGLPVSAPALARPDDNRYRVKLNGGATVEVVAVADTWTGPPVWWKPDGSRLAEAPVDGHIGGLPHVPSGKYARIILVRATGLKKDDLFRWHPTPPGNYWGVRPLKNGQKVPGLEAYVAIFDAGRADCGVRVKVASGPWKTEVSNDGRGGRGQFVNGHKFSFGKARPLSKNGRSMTVFAVAHNFFEQDRRLVAVDTDGRPQPASSYSAGSDGDKKWAIDLIDGEFDLPPEQIREYQVQFRPFEETEIKSIALNPRPEK
jgi:RNA polymerase sigma factor (sigma-70 family)